jgi:hypothetical protein
MNEAQRKALSALKFNYAPTPDDVWKPSPYHVAELHCEVVEGIFEGVGLARSSDDSSPIGAVIQGPSGSGKTHMLGMVRERIQREHGYFFLVSLLSGKAFWESTALCMVEGLLRASIGWQTQLKAFLRRLTAMLGVPAAVRDAIAGDAEVSPEDLATFVAALRRLNRTVGQESQDTARALVLHGSEDLKAQDVGYAYLNSLDGGDGSDRAVWGMTSGARIPQLIVRDISRLLALTGPTVIAIDEIDTLFAQSTGTSIIRSDDSLNPGDAALLGQVADGLMTLRNVTRRTLVLVSCLPDSWNLIKVRAATPVPDRFRESFILSRIPDATIGRAIVEKRLAGHYREIGFKPRYDSWPIKPQAFAESTAFTPRGLLKRVERHVAACLRSGAVAELKRLEEDGRADQEERVPTSSENTAGADLARLDQRFADLVSKADVTAALDSKTEDQEMPALLRAGLAAWIEERGGDTAYKHDPPPSPKPAIHARLRQILDESTEDEFHWSFRAIAGKHAYSVITRVRAACTMAGLDGRVPKRRLILLRNTTWLLGPKTKEAIEAFHDAGGETRSIFTEDLKVFAALRDMLAVRDPTMRAWLIDRKPAGKTELLCAVLGETSAPRGDGPAVANAELEVHAGAGLGAGEAEPAAVTGTRQPTIRLGVVIDRGTPFTLTVESLRRHATIFAGSGSGKTVLIRRLVEECALQGVSAIVLDPNNDLGTLGDAWPEPPSGWEPNDPARAREYLDSTDVVVWTPRREGGRPLSFQPLPDFSAVGDDPDEFRAAIDAAVAALAPRAKMDGATVKAQLGQAVLREALRFYAQHGKNKGLRSFLGILAALPEGVSALAKGVKIASEMAETLTAAMVNDPMFGGDGVPVDPGVLLTPPPGKRARVSVISFIGLHSDQQRQGFVNQLQMALFAWIKRHPAGDRPLGGLFVMDEAQTLAPSGAMTACTASTIALVSQARKYGLGLVFATQAPRGIHNQIPGNSSTQFFGLLNSPIQLSAAREIAQAKGGRVPEIGLLTVGQFYAAAEGNSFQKVQTPMCLTHHPKSPLTPDEVVDRARGHQR